MFPPGLINVWRDRETVPQTFNLRRETEEGEAAFMGGRRGENRAEVHDNTGINSELHVLPTVNLRLPHPEPAAGSSQWANERVSERINVLVSKYTRATFQR